MLSVPAQCSSIGSRPIVVSWFLINLVPILPLDEPLKCLVEGGEPDKPLRGKIRRPRLPAGAQMPQLPRSRDRQVVPTANNPFLAQTVSLILSTTTHGISFYHPSHELAFLQVMAGLIGGDNQVELLSLLAES